MTIANSGTGTKRKVTSGSAGEFAVNLLGPGTYDLTAAAAGFKTFRPST